MSHEPSSMHQASSIKHQASSICFVTNQHTTEVEALLTRQISIIFRRASFPKFEIFRFSILKHENKVWYYQSGPKSVSINPYGIPEPPKPLRNCQSLDWAQKTKKFESLGGQGEFLMILQGCSSLVSVVRQKRKSGLLSSSPPCTIGINGFCLTRVLLPNQENYQKLFSNPDI